MAQTIYLAVVKIGGECLYPSGDSLLHVGISRKSFASHAFLKKPKGMESTGRKIGM
jgi:hypothetical protein